MSMVRLLPRVLVLLVLPFAIAGCASQAGGSTPMRGNPCTSGNGSDNRQAPIVCVDDSNRVLSVWPEPVTVHDVLKEDMRTPVMVHWFTRSGGGDLQLEIEPGCVARHQCDGRGHCWARSMPGSKSSCKYDVWINGGNHDRLDPTIVITGCC
ncbi:MAG TPA: hypothetical protein VEK11_17650 [Thermoanaerobaculia bacterium]|nr:hypothetical protein [Thermoanaerobaculia bacterium]